MATKAKSGAGGSMPYHVISKFLGYRHKTDDTNLPEGVMVKGSQNVLINDGERVAVRNGYVLDGQAAASNASDPVRSSYDWERHSGDTAHLRSHTDKLEFRYVRPDGVTVEWDLLKSGFGAAVRFRYAEFWDQTQVTDALLFVNGTGNVFKWSGGVGVFASATANTITISGTQTFAQLGFDSPTGSVVLGGVTYGYTGGTNTQTLTGVTPDPTAGTQVVGDPVVQAVTTVAISSMTAIPSAFEPYIIATLNNQVYLGSATDRSVYVSQVDSFTDYTFASPRLVGQGAKLTLDGVPVGFMPQEQFMYMTAGKDQWYQTDFTLSSDNKSETLEILRLKTTGQAAAQSQEFISKIKNYIFSVSNEPTLDTLGKLQLIDTPQSVNLSDPIKLDFNAYDFSGGIGGQCFYNKNFIFVSIPADNVVIMYNLAEGRWEAPQILPVGRFYMVDGQLYGHSSQVPESYQLFVGGSDAGKPINAIAAFSYMQQGERANKKRFTQFYTEGYITSNTVLTLELLYDFLGVKGKKTFPIRGDDPRAVPKTGGDGSLGKQSLGDRSLGGRGISQDQSLPPKFRIIKTASALDYYEYQAVYSSNGADQSWQLLAWGPNVELSPSLDNEITE